MRYKFILFIAVLFAAVNTCNPASVKVPDNLCTGVHSMGIKNICHAPKYLDPAGYCGEANCHGLNLKGGNTGGPSCYACHGPYWEVKKLHTLDISGVKHHRDTCTSTDFVVACGDVYCHGPALTGANGYMKSSGCNKCHSIPTANGSNCYYGTHTKDIFGIRHHVDTCTSADFFASCGSSSCHGSALTGTTSQYRTVSGCDKCHGIPTATNNCVISSIQTISHGGHLHGNGSDASCKTTDCHGVSGEGGSTGLFPGRNCSGSGCHDGTPDGGD